MRTVIFDLDGTLADTSGDLIDAANACFRALDLGEPVNPETDQAVAVRGARKMLRLGSDRLGLNWSDEDIEDQVPILVTAYTKQLAKFTYFYPGAIEAVKTLRANGFAVGICTNKPELQAEKLINEMGVRPLFDSLIARDTLSVCKPDSAPFVAAVERAGGDPKRAMLIGDSDTDHNTARNAGVPSVLVTFSPIGRAVSELAPDAMLDHFDDLPALAERLLD